MTVQEIVPILADYRDEIAATPIESLVDRREEHLIDWDSNLAQVVIGVRRCGKSTMCMKSLMSRGVKFAYMNFDDERVEGLQTSDLNRVLEALYIVYGEFQYLFLDEIQNVDGWPLFVNRLLRQRLYIVLTGSNAKLLSNELMTHLTGRHNEIDLFPFSFAEYVSYMKLDMQSMSTRATALLKNALIEYLHNGGMPELLHEKNRQRYVTKLMDSIVSRDIARRFKIRNVPALRKMANYLADNFAQKFVAQNVGEVVGISDHTAEKYYTYLKEAFLLQGVPKFSFKSRERNHSEKVYVVDTAFAATREGTFSMENLGWRLENVVFVELMRRSHEDYDNIFYYRDRSFEVDFIRSGYHEVKELIQVCYDLSSPKTRRREIEGLLKGADRFRCSKLTLITLDKYETIELDGHTIQIIPAADWLLGKSSTFR